MKTWKSDHIKKVINPRLLRQKVADLRAGVGGCPEFGAGVSSQKTIATVNGSFDLLHAGHLQFIYEASQVADILIVALNTDRSIQEYKSPDRPIIPLEYRIEMMTALEFVDYVTWFDETDPCQILEKIRPDVHVNGSEYGENCIESETVKKYGGRIHIVNKIPGLSTSEIIKKIQKLKN